jgi:hypothetical protein
MRGALSAIALFAPVLCAQTIVPAPPGGLPPAGSLRCGISPIHPSMNFGLRLQAGYTINVPLVQYKGPGHKWRVLVRIEPRDPAGAPVYLASQFELAPVPETKAEGEIGGAFLLGEGRYEASLALQDDLRRVCTAGWQIDANGRSVRGLENLLPPGTVAELSSAPAQTHQDAVFDRLTVLVHAAPAVARESRLQASDLVTSLGELSSLLAERPARSVRLVVFNLAQQTELLRQEPFHLADLNHVQQALYNLQLARVDYRVLQNRGGEADLLTGIVERELDASDPPDAVVFLGPRLRSPSGLAKRALSIPKKMPRFFYVARWRAPRRTGGTPNDMEGRFGALPLDPLPARVRSGTDVIAEMVARLKGKTFDVQSPSDFAKAIRQIGR